MQKRYKKRSELTEKTNMGYPTLADELNIETVNDQLAKVPGFEHMLTYGSKKPRFISGGGNETLRIESINESVSRITNGMQGLFEVRESKKKITEQKQKPYKMSKTYEIWDEEAINAGATDNSGFEYKKQTFDSLWELAKEIRDGGGSESSSSQSNPHNYYTTDADEDIRTGEKTFYSFHPEGLSKDDAVQLDAFLDMDERDFRKSEPRDESVSRVNRMQGNLAEENDFDYSKSLGSEKATKFVGDIFQSRLYKKNRNVKDWKHLISVSLDDVDGNGRQHYGSVLIKFDDQNIPNDFGYDAVEALQTSLGEMRKVLNNPKYSGFKEWKGSAVKPYGIGYEIKFQYDGEINQ